MEKELLDQISKEDLIKYLIKNKDEDRQIIGIIELTNEHMQHLRAIERHEETIIQHSRASDLFISFCIKKGIKDAHEVKRRHTNEFYNKLPFTKYTNIGIYKRLKAQYNYGLIEGYIGKNPFYLRLSFPEEPIHIYWTPEYFNQLIKAIRNYAPPSRKFKYELIIRILFTTGVRIGKLLELRRNNIIITSTKEVILDTTKKTINKKNKRHPFEITNEKAKDMILSLLKKKDEKIKDNYMIFDYKNCRHGQKNVRIGLKNVCKKANMSFLGLHKAKHGYITMLAKEGLTAEQVCKLTGNTSVELVRKRYIHFEQKNLIEKVTPIVKNL